MRNTFPNILAVPFPSQGHVYPLINFSKKMVEHGCKITFVNAEFIHKRVMSSMANQQEGLDDDSPIKLVSIPDGLGPDVNRDDPFAVSASLSKTMPAMLEKLIEDSHLNGGKKITCIIVDMGMAWALEVGRKLGLKSVLYWPSSATMSALQCNITNLIEDGIIDSEGFPVKDGPFQICPNIPAIDTKVIWWTRLLDIALAKKTFNFLVHCMQYKNLAEWWICNSTYELEPGPISSLPKLLPVGPLIKICDNANVTTKSLGLFWEEDLSCMSWLDQQPPRSVTYVAFGSITLFDQNQFNELALALDLTNRPFLWVVRQDNMMKYPNEFLGSKGKIVAWAPQMKVLSHPAVACFVSHCGWNSTMEGVSNGIPFLCWPYFTDQFFNKSHICDELKVGVGLNPDANGQVSRWEIKKKLDHLISDEQIRTRSLELKENVMNNIADGGECLKNISRLVNWLKS